MNFAAAFCYWCVFHIEKRGKKTDIETRAHDENEQEFYACFLGRHDVCKNRVGHVISGLRIAAAVREREYRFALLRRLPRAHRLRR